MFTRIAAVAAAFIVGFALCAMMQHAQASSNTPLRVAGYSAFFGGQPGTTGYTLYREVLFQREDGSLLACTRGYGGYSYNTCIVLTFSELPKAS